MAAAARAIGRVTLLLAAGLAAQPYPQRIVSVVPALTEMLYAIGAGPALVGVSSFDRHPPDVERLPRVGGLLDPDLETILSLRPDLVLVYRTQTALQEQLRRAGVPMFEYEHGRLADVMTTIRALGEATGHAAEAGRVAAALEAEIARIRDAVRNRPRPRTLIVVEREPLTLRHIYASGGLDFLHDMLEVAGGENVLAGVNRRAVQASVEMILAAAPDVILEVRAVNPLSDEALARDREAWAPLSSVPAVRRGEIHFLVGGELVVPGPRIVAGIARMAEALHPAAFAPKALVRAGGCRP